MQLCLYCIKNTLYCCFSKGKEVSYNKAAPQNKTDHTDLSSDTHLMDQTWWSPMWNLVMRVCTPARSSLSWTWLKPEANSLCVVRSCTFFFFYYASIFNYVFYSCSYLFILYFLKIYSLLSLLCWHTEFPSGLIKFIQFNSIHGCDKNQHVSEIWLFRPGRINLMLF